jgi:acyl-CoA thioester hydrolase
MADAMKKFSYQLTVEPAAIDLFGHVNNAEYVRWVQDAAQLHSMHVGYGWEEYRSLGAAFVIRRHEIDYLRSAHQDDVLEVATWIDSHTRISALRATEIRDASGELILRAMTTWVWVSLTTMRPQRIPDEVRQRFLG